MRQKQEDFSHYPINFAMFNLLKIKFTIILKFKHYYFFILFMIDIECLIRDNVNSNSYMVINSKIDSILYKM